MPVCIEHSRKDRVVKHKWTFLHLGAFLTAVKDETDLNPWQDVEYPYEFREEHTFDLGETGMVRIFPGDSVKVWRE